MFFVHYGLGAFAITLKKKLGSGSGWSVSSDVIKLTRTRIAARRDVTGERSRCTDQVPPNSEKRASARAAHQSTITSCWKNNRKV